MDWKEQQAKFGALIQPRQVQPQAPQQQPQKKKKNFWMDQISTVGGIGGGILGSFASPLLGTAAGAGVGSALGESLENLLTGESIGKNVAKEGALGAAFGVGPIRGVKALAGAGKAAMTGGKIAQGAAQAAGGTVRGAAGKALTDASDDLVVKQFRFTPTQLKNFKGKFGEDAAQVAKRYGFQNADDVVSKGVEPLQAQFDDAIKNIPGVTKAQLQQQFKSKYEPLLKSAVQDNVAIGKNLRSQSQSILKKYGDVIDAKELNTLRREFDSLVNYTERTANPARYGVNKRAADAIRTTLQKSDPSGSLQGLGKELQKLNQFADNAAKQSQLGRGSNPLGLSTLLGGTIGSAGGPAGAIAGAASSAAFNSGAGKRAMASGAQSLGNKLTASGAKSAASGLSPLAIGGRVGMGGLASGIANQAPQVGQQPQDLETALAGSQGQPMMQQPQEPVSQTPYSRENLMADVQRDPENADEYFKLFQMYDEIFSVPEQKPLTGEAQKRALTAQSGLRSLDTLDETLGSDPGAFQRQALPNPLGITAGLTGTTDVRAATDNVVDVIARLRSGAAITDAEAARFARFLPQPGDSQESALKKLQSVRAELESFMQPSGGGSSLEEALMGMQGAY